MRIYRRGKKKIYWIDYTDTKGNRHRESTKTTNRRLAEEALAKRMNSITEGTFDINKPEILTFEEFAKDFLQHCSRKKANTRIFYKVTIKPLLEYFKDKFLSDITAYMIEQYKEKRFRKVSVTTVKREMTTLNYFFNCAVLWNKALKNPMKEVEKIKEPPGRIRWLELDDVKLLLSQCKALYLKMIVMIALHTGMRKGEILALRKEHIDLVNKIITVEENRSTGIAGTTKSGKRRHVPINRTLLPALNEWMEPCKEDRLFAYDDIKKGFAAAVKRAGITDFTFHDLRHTFASHMVMSGVDIVTVSKLLGHSSINMTMKYAHLSPDHKRLAVEKLSELFSS